MTQDGDTRYIIRTARDARDIERAQRLRHRAFFKGAEGLDHDPFDAESLHILVEDRRSGRLVGCARVRIISPENLAQSYSAQFYDLSVLGLRPGPLMEMGRFCVSSGQADSDILRLIWGALTRIVDREGVQCLFGCLSFAGADPLRHGAALAWLGCHNTLDEGADIRAITHDALALRDIGGIPERRAALAAMPALLRSYLSMGGRVSSDAVIDRALDTLHVLVTVEIAAIPEARRQSLRRVAMLQPAYDGDI